MSEFTSRSSCNIALNSLAPKKISINAYKGKDKFLPIWQTLGMEIFLSLLISEDGPFESTHIVSLWLAALNA